MPAPYQNKWLRRLAGGHSNSMSFVSAVSANHLNFLVRGESAVSLNPSLKKLGGNATCSINPLKI